MPDSEGKCNNTGEASQLEETVALNVNWNSPSDVGYMYGTRYEFVYENMSYITDTYKYGNDVTYSNGAYTLTGKTMSSSSWPTDRETLADGYHYTCLNSTGTCEEVYYITYFGYKDIYGHNNIMYYLTFTGGDNLDTAKKKMFSNDNDSTIKAYVDTWYKGNLIDYTGYLENTIFCNDRSFASENNGGPLLSKDINSIGDSKFAGYERRSINYSPSLSCSNQNDRFSLKTDSGGMVGYGNNALKYPVGLLTSDEAMLAGVGAVGKTENTQYYLYTGIDYYLNTADSYTGQVFYCFNLQPTGSIGGVRLHVPLGVRPVVSLKSGTEIIRGTGTFIDPYLITE